MCDKQLLDIAGDNSHSNIVFGTCNYYFTQYRGLRYWNSKVRYNT